MSEEIEHFLEYYKTRSLAVNQNKIDNSALNSIERWCSDKFGYNYKLHDDISLSINDRISISVNGNIEYCAEQPAIKNIDPSSFESLHLRNISGKIRKLVTGELVHDYYKIQIEAIVDRHFNRGQLNEFWMKVLCLHNNGFDSPYFSLAKWMFKIGFARIKNWHSFGTYLHLSQALNDRVKELSSEMYDALQKKEFTDISIADFENSFITDLIVFPQSEIRLYHNFNATRYPLLSIQSDPWSREKEFHVTVASMFNNVDLNLSLFLNDQNQWYEYLETFSRGENWIRDRLGMPKIGEGWISETILFYSLKKYMPDELIVHHGRPTWLGRQHLDIFFPKRNIAIEYHGDQHFQPVEYFGGEESFQNNKLRDAKKRELCKQNGCFLIEVDKSYQIEKLLFEIKSLFN